MLVLRRPSPSAAPPCVLTIGNFDGLHLGHRAMIDRLKARGRELGLPSVVMTFEPHPRELFAPDRAPARLTSLREKLRLLDACEIDRVFLCHFTRHWANLSAEEFIDRLLIEQLAVRHLVIGDDFRFGRGRTGDFALLAAAGQRLGFGVEAMPTIEIDGERVSSSAVRAALARGELEHAARLLGRPYEIAGRVVHGQKTGRRMGFPTANVQLKRKRVPLSGVFAVLVSGLDKRHLPGVANLGVRPTFGGTLQPVLEVHLFDFDRAIYGHHVSVHFLHKLRDEMRFASQAELADQIARDIAATHAWFAGR